MPERFSKKVPDPKKRQEIYDKWEDGALEIAVTAAFGGVAGAATKEIIGAGLKRWGAPAMEKLAQMTARTRPTIQSAAETGVYQGFRQSAASPKPTPKDVERVQTAAAIQAGLNTHKAQARVFDRMGAAREKALRESAAPFEEIPFDFTPYLPKFSAAGD